MGSRYKVQKISDTTKHWVDFTRPVANPRNAIIGAKSFGGGNLSKSNEGILAELSLTGFSTFKVRGNASLWRILRVDNEQA